MEAFATVLLGALLLLGGVGSVPGDDAGVTTVTDAALGEEATPAEDLAQSSHSIQSQTQSAPTTQDEDLSQAQSGLSTSIWSPTPSAMTTLGEDLTQAQSGHPTLNWSPTPSGVVIPGKSNRIPSQEWEPKKIEYGQLFSYGINFTAFSAMFSPVSVRIKNEECRRQGEIYLRELHRFTLWATQMFDSTTKFPVGTLWGSTFDMGNFDECVMVDANVGHENVRIQGQYCLAKITYDRIVPDAPVSAIDLRNLEHLKYANTSTWSKIEVSRANPSWNPRNEVYWAFCIPSACSASDWEVHLNDILEHYTAIHQFHAVATVEESMCQVFEPLTLSLGAIILILVFGFFLMVVSGCTSYDVLPILFKKERKGWKATPPLWHRLALCFSARANIEKLLTYKESSDGLECIHGLKLMSLCLIIMGHRLMFNLGAPLTNTEFVERFYTKVTSMILLNGPIVVDTFFGISGFLVCYLLLQEYNKRGRLNILMLYVHRYVRLTPVYMVVLAFYTTLLLQFGSGPLWEHKVGKEAERCAESWWANVLYVNNYVNPEKLCMFQSWYITCDMHLFIISPPIVYLLWKRPVIGKTLLFVVTAASIVTSFLVTYLGKLDALLLLYMKTLSDPIANETFRSMYIPTHTRASPYFIGMAAGYAKYLIQTKQMKIPKVAVWVGWLVALVCIEGTIFSAWVFYSPGRPYNALLAALYGAFHRITWSVGTSWIIIAVSTGNGDFLKPFLVWPPIITLSRMTYSAFLAHGALQLYSVASTRNPFYGSIYHLIWLTLGDIVLSFGASFVLTLLFESPIIGLEKIIFGRGSKSDCEDDGAIEEHHHHHRRADMPSIMEMQDRVTRRSVAIEVETHEIRIRDES